jgi:hypothetical protein
MGRKELHFHIAVIPMYESTSFQQMSEMLMCLSILGSRKIKEEENGGDL